MSIQMLLIFGLGVTAGCIIKSILSFIFCEFGYFVITESEDKTLYRIELDRLDRLSKKKFVLLDIKRDNNMAYYENKK